MAVHMGWLGLDLVLDGFLFWEFKPFGLKHSEMKSLKKEPDNSVTFFWECHYLRFFFQVFKLDFGSSHSLSLSLEIFFQPVLLSIVTITKYSTDLKSRSANFQSFHLYLLKKKE